MRNIFTLAFGFSWLGIGIALYADAEIHWFKGIGLMFIVVGSFVLSSQLSKKR